MIYISSHHIKNGLYIITFMGCHPFRQDFVLFEHGQWTDEVSLQAKDITQCPATELSGWNNNRATIMKEIAHIHFTALTHLHLGDNRIESVEGLARVQMAHIKFVALRNNNITSVGVIRKAAWPRLQLLNIVNNYFGDAHSLVHGCFLHMTQLDVYSIRGDKNGFRNHCFAAKMQADSLKDFSIRKNEFCDYRCLKRVLQERWPGVVIK